MELSRLRRVINKVQFDEEYIINQNFQWKEGDGTFIALTRKDKELSLWLAISEEGLLENEEASRLFEKKLERGTLTEREHFLHGSSKNLYICSVNEFLIQGNQYRSSSMDSFSVMECSSEADLFLLYFMEKGVNYGLLEQKNHDSIYLAQFIIEGEHQEIPVDVKKPFSIQIMPCKRTRRVLVGKRAALSIREYKNKKVELYDKMKETSYDCYINQIGLYDPWSKEQIKKFDMPEYKKKYTEKEIETMKEQYFSYMKKVCPKGKKFAYVEYETKEHICVDFHTREFLQKKVECQNAAAVLMFFANEEETIGKHGMKVNYCIMETVDEDTIKIPIELLWFYVEDEIGATSSVSSVSK